jgi:hypothetical protein
MGDKKEKSAERRGPDRRKKDIEVEVDRREAIDRRGDKDRRLETR